METSHLPWQVRTENYEEFLKSLGISWAVRKVALRITMSPTFTIKEGRLHCCTICFGAKPVHEVLEAGESVSFEPNMGVEYAARPKTSLRFL